VKGRWGLLLLAAVAVICVGLAQTSQGHVVLRDTGLYEPPATYTELTFNDPAALPSLLKKPSSNIKVSFSIHNVSNVSRSYQWSIDLVHANESQVKASGTAQTPAQGRIVVNRSVAATCVGGRMQVVVRLNSPGESIGFWMTCPPTAVKKQVGA
jgi:hypothetical protein